MIRDISKNYANQQEARNSSIVSSNKIIYSNNMETNRKELVRRLLSRITNGELKNLVRMREEARCSIPSPRRNVQQLVQYFEANPIPYRPIPAPRRKKQQRVAAPRTRISEKWRALNHFTKSYEIDLKSDRDALV